MSLRYFERDAPLEPILESIKQQGGAIINNALAPDLMARFIDELAPYQEATP